MGISCNLTQQAWSPLQKRSPIRKQVTNLLLKGSTSKNGQSESNQSIDGPSGSFTKLHPMLTQRNDREIDANGERMPTLDELNPEEYEDTISDDDIIDIITDEKARVGGVKGRKGPIRNPKPLTASVKTNMKLAAGW